MRALLSHWWPGRVLVLVTVVGVVAAGVTLAVMGRGDRSAGAARPRQTMLPVAPSSAPPTIVAPDGRTVACPTGSVPATKLTEASFNPALAGGSAMDTGRYQIRLRGTVANETNQPITVREVRVTVRGQPWPARVTVPAEVAAQSSVDLAIEGTYDSSSTGAVDIKTELAWAWQAGELASCGEAGLIEDD